MDDPELVRRWQAKQEVLKRTLSEAGGAELEYRLNLDAGQISWLGPDERPRVVAEAKVLCTWSAYVGTVLMGWLNESLAPGMAVGPYPGLPEDAQECDEQEAWDYAMLAGEEAGAQAIFPCPGPTMVFLGLWNLRPARPEEAFALGAIVPDMLRLVDSLSQRLGQRPILAEEIREDLQHGAEVLRQQARYARRGTPDEPRLREMAAALRRLAEALPARGALPAEAVQRLDSALAKLRQEWQDLGC